MVEINNQRKAFLDMLAWSEELISTSKPEIVDVIVGGELFTDYLITSQTCHAKPKTQICYADASFPVGGMPTASMGWPERLLSESQDAVALQQIKERGVVS